MWLQMSSFFRNIRNLTFVFPFPPHASTYSVLGRACGCSHPMACYQIVPSWACHTIARKWKMKNTILLGLVRTTQPITDLPEHEHLHIGYNVTHDAGLIAMAFEVGTSSEKQQAWIDPPAHRIGVDVMRLSIPDRFTFQTFVETVGDAVRTFQFRCLPHTPSYLLSTSSVWNERND